MRTWLKTVALLPVVFLLGCDTPNVSRSILISPTPVANAPADASAAASTPTPAPTGPPSSTIVTQTWTITSTFTGVIGPESCVARQSRPVVPSRGTTTIFRDGDSITIKTEHDSYTGKVVDGAFLARDPIEDMSYWICDKVRVPARVEYEVSGKFGDQERSLQAEEVSRYNLDNGETVTQHWQWTGTLD